MEATFKAKGKLQELELSPLVISHPHLNFDGSLLVNKVFDPSVSDLKLTMKALQIDMELLNSLSFIPTPLKEELSRVSDLNLTGVTSINSDSVQFDLEANHPWGKFKINGGLGKGILDQS